MDSEIHHYPWLREEMTLAERFSEAGYYTGICGKCHIGSDETSHPGFDYWFTLSGEYPSNHFGTYLYSENGQEKRHTGYKTPIITDHAIQFLKNRDKEKPFFLFVGYNAPHSPWEGHPERLMDDYRNCTFNDIRKDESYPFGQQNLESEKMNRENEREGLAVIWINHPRPFTS